MDECEDFMSDDIQQNEQTPELIKKDEFVHLHLHSSYSLLDGAVKLPNLISLVQELGMSTVALTDHGNMHGAIDFYKRAKKAGIKPILGCEIYVAQADRKSRSERRSYHLVLLAENNKGYENLCYLVSMANLEGFYRKPRIDHQILADHHEGLIATSACLSGEIPVAIRENRLDDARKLALEYKELFGPENFFLEVQMNGIPAQTIVNDELVKISKELDIPLIGTNDVHYLLPEDSDYHDTLLCIGRGKLKNDPNRARYDTDTLYLRPASEMKMLFSEFPGAVENTVRVAERCHVELELDEPKLPLFVVPDGYDQDSYFEKMTREGFAERLVHLPYEIDLAKYEKRLEYEMDVIKRMKFSGYFLIVADFIQWGKNNGIPVGPGRGSGVGSLVAYSLKITDLDPIPYKLIFERFLNPERISMPDFDVDFCMNRRDEVINYVTNKYGKDKVGQIATFGTLKARGVVRDVCRVFDIPVAEADRIAKCIPEGPKTTLDSALEEEPRLKEVLAEKPEYRSMYETALRLEGMHRHTGVHAAGIVISEKPLWNISPLLQNEGQLITQYAKDEVEAVGLVKFDFLGLKTLTVIDEAVRLVNKTRPAGDPLNILAIPLDDPKVYNLISSGDTNGVFQMESGGFQRMLKRLKPDRFEDIILAVAIYRPGPMQYIPNCVDRKFGREEIQLVHPVLEPILMDTYGLIVYQEQVMQIAAEMGGFSMGQADTLRKAMGKKKAKLMTDMLEKFSAGAMERGYSAEIIERVTNDMVTFASYGFNKSHAAAYGLISYQTAYLKTYYPKEFLAATLTNDDNVVKFVQEAKRMGVKVLPPCANESNFEFTVEGGAIRFGLGAVKGVGGGAIDAIIESRKEKPYTSIYNFCERVDLSRVNKKAIESLIKAGAFDFSGIGRSRILASVEKAVDSGNAKRKERESGQINLMDMFAKASPSNTGTAFQEDYQEVQEWTERERLGYESESMGLYLSAHPMDRYQEEARRYTKSEINRVTEMDNREEVVLAGVVASLRDMPTRDGKGRMAFFMIQDSFGMIECCVFKRAYPDCAEHLSCEEPLLVYGQVMVDGEGDESVHKISVSKIVPLIDVMKSRAKRVHIHFMSDSSQNEIGRLAQTLSQFPGACPVVCHVKREGEYESLVALPQKWCVDPSTEMLDHVETLIGQNSVVLE
jgi:DNA polymerase-3 subunit alpha